MSNYFIATTTHDSGATEVAIPFNNIASVAQIKGKPITTVQLKESARPDASYLIDGTLNDVVKQLHEKGVLTAIFDKSQNTINDYDRFAIPLTNIASFNRDNMDMCTLINLRQAAGQATCFATDESVRAVDQSITRVKNLYIE